MSLFEFKPGVYYVCDPCYLIDDRDLWWDVCRQLEDSTRTGLMVKLKGYEFFACSTNYGDGSYMLYPDRNLLYVDSGTLSIIPKELVEILGSLKKTEKEYIVEVEIDTEFYVTTDGLGNFNFDRYKVITDGSDEEDEEEEYEDFEDGEED